VRVQRGDPRQARLGERGIDLERPGLTDRRVSAVPGALAEDEAQAVSRTAPA
jgi:hypothetical protein